ncbi:MAG: pyridoxine 5'-phosphate synthase [Saprospiraceae bacterium]|nr:pyridoxine 5'-phosphate synthase [Saprospiraceae bacterium]
MTRLSVNINKIALIRNSRGGNLPDLIKVALDCERFGAEGITVHPRPDQRHIRYSDIPLLKAVVKTEFNIEGFPTPEFIDLVCKNKPAQVTLVPDAPNVLTSDQGWDIETHRLFLIPIIKRFKDIGIRVSLFMDPDPEMLIWAKEVEADRIELYTGDYAKTYESDQEVAVKNHILVADRAAELGIGINAGHDLNLQNLKYYKQQLSNLLEVSIGHSLVCDAIYLGLENVIPMYLKCLK